jgi:hypothetical protein
MVTIVESSSGDGAESRQELEQALYVARLAMKLTATDYKWLVNK